MKFEYHKTLTSTMDRAREVSAPVLIVAEEQTKGRGRQGNVWESSHKGIYLTLALKKRFQAQFYQGLSLAVGVIIAEFFEQNCEHLNLKWPNDLLDVNEKKVGGILIELLTDTILVGVGINLSKPEDLPQASTLNIKDVDLRKLSKELGEEIAKGFLAFEHNGFLPFKEAWLKRGCWLGKKIQGIINEVAISGVFCGIDDNGLLLLETKEGIKTISSGEISSLRI